MDEGNSRHPSKLLLKLFQEAWKELCAESEEANPSTTIQIETKDGEKKNVNGFEFWKQMIEEVERQKDDPDYLIYSSIDEEQIEHLFSATRAPQPGEEPAFYSNGKYYIPRISNLYMQNLDLGYDQWFIAQAPNHRLMKIERRKRYFSPSSTDDEIIIELIYAIDLSEKMNKGGLANKKKEIGNKKEDVKKDAENMTVNLIHEKFEMEEFKNLETSKPTEKDNSNIIEMNAMVQTEEQQCNIADIENTQSTLLEQERTVQTNVSYRNQADELEKQLQALEKGHIYMEDVMEMEDPKEMNQMPYKEKNYATCRIDLCSNAEEVDEVPEKTEQTSEQVEFGTNYFFDLASCLEDVFEVPIQQEQLSHVIESKTSYSIDLNEVSDVPPKKITHVQVAQKHYQDPAWRDLSPNIATQNVNPQNLGINMNDPNVVTSPHIPLMISPNYEPLPTHRSPRLLFPYLPRTSTPPLAHMRIYHQTILNSGFPPPAHQTQRTSFGYSAERNQQSVPYPSINPSSQWTPQSKPMIIHNPNNLPNYDSENFQMAHEQPRTQIPPNIPPDANNLHFINDVLAHQSSISTSLVSRERVVEDITHESFWEYILIIKKKLGETLLIAQAPLSSIIPIPDDDIEDGNQDDIEDGNQDDIEDGNQDDIQSDKCVKFEIPSITAKPKKKRRVHFSQSVIKKDEMKN